MSDLPPDTKPNPDDIDSLLDQVEKKYFTSAEAKRLSEMPAKDCQCSVRDPNASVSSTSSDWKEVNDMLQEFVFDDQNSPFNKVKNDPKPGSRKTSSSDDNSEERRKCFATYLSGSYAVMGYCQAGGEKPCSTLKCLQCDFKVVYFDNYTWTPKSDYLFLRNNFPEFERLSTHLRRKKGGRAYACQCHCLNIDHLVNILTFPSVRWVCGRHDKAE